ncbi:MAG: copper chaperone PCu(A)C [Anaerolineae bacterium]|nr:copper chaperone PCu(A)C [Anaerolineales bacterium]MCQ3976410.1 copper chaperone PCu(A)C [Anaerolineae bacterium]
MFSWKVNLISITLAGLLAVILSSCSAAAAGPQIVQHDAWGRPSPKMAGAGAVYVVIENKGSQADRLIGATSAASAKVELHESYMDGDVMKMRPVPALDIPAGSTLELKPGSYHIMLIELVKPLERGSHISVTLKFEKSGELPLDVEIRE